MPFDLELPEDLADSVDIVYLDDDELDNLEDTEIPESGDDIDPPEDKSVFTFKEHTRSVFCVNLNNDNTLAVTGGEDDLAYVWQTKTGEVLFECTGHKDSVTAASFSHDGKYVVTGDMGGLIQVWDVANKNLLWCYEGDELEWLIWHHAAHVLLAGVQSGEIYMWQIPQGNCKVFPTNGSKCTCGVLLPNGTQVAAGYEDGSIRIWDLKSTSIVNQVSNETTGGAVTGISCSADGKLMITCGLTSGALVIKTADCKVAAHLKGVGSEEIESAAFCSETDLPIVATGSLNGEVCFWDISRQALRHTASIGYSVTQMLWGPNAMLFVSSVDGTVYAYNGRTGQLLATLTGHAAAVLDIKLTKDSQFLMTSSDDGTVKLFDIQKCCVTS